MQIRNIAIIAHVDHGKTTLVDQLLTQSGTMNTAHDTVLIMDSNDQERERGITIYAKNTSIVWWDMLINIIDTPWHADFGSEVERVLRMVDSVVLVVDAYEWPMPQTKFVLKKALEQWLHPIVVLNKIDKPTARPSWVINELFDLFISLNATDEQAQFPIVYASAKNGYATLDIDSYDPLNPPQGIAPLIESIVNHVPPAPFLPDEPLRLQIVNLGYDDYVWRLGIWRITTWTVHAWSSVVIYNNNGEPRKWKVTKVYTTRGLSRIEAPVWQCGDIVTLAGISDIFIWDTVTTPWWAPFPPLHIDEPTLTMDFLVNDSPFMWREGKQVTSRNLMERLQKELEVNVWLQVDFSQGNRFPVSWRWELHLSVLIETMRREWYELQVSAPQVIFKTIDWTKHEPMENVYISVLDELSGTIIEQLSNRKWLLQNMYSAHGSTTLEFLVPTRGLLWFRSDFILLTKGEGILYTSYAHYERYKWDIPKRNNGSMISQENGKAMKYSIWKLQERWIIFVEPGQEIYEGMIVGESAKPWDLSVNLTKNKQQNNVRESWNDESMRLSPIVRLSLEDALAYIWPDEYVEITPRHIRLRKIYLTSSDRERAKKHH
jgi:GTP-binding protein